MQKVILRCQCNMSVCVNVSVESTGNCKTILIDQKQALLLHTAGMAVQDIFYAFPGRPGEDDVVVKMVSVLNDYFTPLANVMYERVLFRKTIQLSDENIEQYITLLRQRA